MSDVATHYDAPQPLSVTVGGRVGREQFQETLEVFEMTTDDLAASIDDLLAIMAVVKAPANKAAITEGANGQLQVAQDLIVSILAVAKGATYNLMARCTGKEAAFFGCLYQASTLAMVAAVMGANPDFFSMVLRMLSPGPAAERQETSGAVNHPESAR